MGIPDESDLAKLDFYDGLRTHMLYYTTPSVSFSVEIFHGICYVRTRVIVYGFTLLWRHNERDSVSNHQRLYCLLKRLFRRRSKIASKLRATGLCAWNSPETGEFPAQKDSNAENVFIWWRHHGSGQVQSSHGRHFVILYSIKYIDGIVQDCSNSIANALELLQSYTKPSIYSVLWALFCNGYISAPGESRSNLPILVRVHWLEPVQSYEFHSTCFQHDGYW